MRKALMVAAFAAVAVYGTAWAGTSLSTFDDGGFGDFTPDTNGNASVIAGQLHVVKPPSTGAAGFTADDIVWFAQGQLTGDYVFEFTFDLATSEAASGTLEYNEYAYARPFALPGGQYSGSFFLLRFELNPVSWRVWADVGAAKETVPAGTTSIRCRMDRSGTTATWSVDYGDGSGMHVLHTKTVTDGTVGTPGFVVGSDKANVAATHFVFDDVSVTGPSVDDFSDEVPPPPLASSVAGPVMTGGSVSLTAPDGSDYVWYKDGQVIPGATGQMLAIDDVQESDAGVYTCTFVDAATQVTRTTTPYTLNVIDASLLPVATTAGLGMLAVSLCALAAGLVARRNKRS